MSRFLSIYAGDSALKQVQQNGLQDIEIVKDLAGRDRVVAGYNAAAPKKV